MKGLFFSTYVWEFPLSASLHLLPSNPMPRVEKIKQSAEAVCDFQRDIRHERSASESRIDVLTTQYDIAKEDLRGRRTALTETRCEVLRRMHESGSAVA